MKYRFTWDWDIAIMTCAFRTILSINTNATAISTIIIAFSGVGLIITISITNPWRYCTLTDISSGGHWNNSKLGRNSILSVKSKVSDSFLDIVVFSENISFTDRACCYWIWCYYSCWYWSRCCCYQLNWYCGSCSILGNWIKGIQLVIGKPLVVRVF